MYRSAFFETEFYLLVATSFVLPVAIYAYLMWRQLLSRTTILLFSSLLLALSGVDVYLLRALRALASASLSGGPARQVVGAAWDWPHSCIVTLDFHPMEPCCRGGTWTRNA